MKIRLIISGLVQGVCFRANAKQEADRLGLKGFIRNIEDGVETVVMGDEGNVREFIEWCKKGPKCADVNKVEAEDISVEKEFKDFEIRNQ